MGLSRRNALQSLVGGAGAIALGGVPQGGFAQAPSKRTLEVATFAYTLAVQVPVTAALMETIPAMPAYGAPHVVHFPDPALITSGVISGTSELAMDAPEAVVASAAQSAGVRIFGLVYGSVDLVFVVNSDRVKDIKDLEKPENVVAISTKGDTTWVMFVGPLLKSGVDINKVTTMEIGGSGDRMKALLSGRVQAVPVHYDQVSEIQKLGPYKVLFEPWKVYRLFPAQVWAARDSWLKKPGNGQVAVDIIKATTLNFRRATRDFDWFLQMYRKYVSLPDAKTATEQTVRPVWSKLATDVKAWPDVNTFTVSDLNGLLPVYKSAGVFSGQVRAQDVVDTSYAQTAMKELGRQGLS